MAIVICCVAAVILYITVPKINPALKHNLTIDTHGIVPYFLKITAGNFKYTETILDESFTITLIHGEYDVQVCYYDIEGKTRCETNRVYLDEDVTTEFFVVIEE